MTVLSAESRKSREGIDATYLVVIVDAISEERLSQVHPFLAKAIHRMAEMLDPEGIVLMVMQGLRTWQQQAILYAQGRTAPGPIVTKAQPGYSWHNFALAVDALPKFESQPIDWNPQHPQWQRMEQVGVSLGLTAGAEWRTFPDYPHFQIGSLPVTPTDDDRQAFKDGSIPAVWLRNGLAVPPTDPELGL